jgi:peptide deformylase
MDLEKLEIVAVDKIPREGIVNIPADNLLKIYKFCQKMVKICKSNLGIGLAAPQVGVPWNLFKEKWN